MDMGIQNFFSRGQIIRGCTHTPDIATFQNLATEYRHSSHFGKVWKNVIEQQGCRTGRSRGERGGAARAAPTEVPSQADIKTVCTTTNLFSGLPLFPLFSLSLKILVTHEL